MVLSLGCVVELNKDLGCCGDPCDVVKFRLGGGRSPTRLSRVDRDGGRDGDRSETINEFPVRRCDFIRAKPEVESRPAVSLLLLLVLLQLLLTQWDGSRLLRSIFEDLESLVDLEDESKELLGGVLRGRLLSIHAMSEGESGKEERESDRQGRECLEGTLLVENTKKDKEKTVCCVEKAP